MKPHHIIEDLHLTVFLQFKTMEEEEEEEETWSHYLLQLLHPH